MIRAVSLIALAMALLAGVDGACHLNCNGKGSCGSYDVCSCYGSYDYESGKDCSLRVCPYGKTRGTIDSTNVHKYKECSENGVCNRKTGECDCGDGFTGRACDRTDCPNDCGKNGQCQLLSTFNTAYTTAWDADATMICMCDPGYEGAGCELRMCPLGDDPLTLQSSVNNGFQVDEEQTCTITQSGAMTGKFTLKFTDWTGKQHETWPFDITTVTSAAVKEALQALPNNVIPDCTVDVSGDPSSANVVIVVTFTATENSGAQELLTIGTDDYSVDGHQPIKATIANFVTGTTLCAKTTVGTNEENSICSGRGTCNSETGECGCFTGFHGHSCASQTSLQ